MTNAADGARDRAMTAAKYAKERGINVNMLATMDPVDGFAGIRTGNEISTDPKKFDPFRKDIYGLWVNGRATRYERKPDLSDRIASAGGRMDSVAQGKADVYKDIDRHHEDFNGMMGDMNVEGMISGIYSNWSSLSTK